MRMVTYMRVFGKMIRLMDRECISIKMGRNTWDCGKKINNMDSESKSGQTEQNTMETSKTERKMKIRF